MLRNMLLFLSALLLLISDSINALRFHQSRRLDVRQEKHSDYLRKKNTLKQFMGTANDVEWDLKLRSPCKLNLFLRILGRRPTGFHDLASLFQAISLSDYLYISKLPDGSEKDEMTCSDPTLAVTDDNLVIKALELMRDKTKIKQYFRVHLEKSCPIQAGLGGGSGNAATAMQGFNVLLDFPVKEVQKLVDWSGDIGSDISFFFSSGTAYCTGRGEIVQSMPSLPKADEVVVDLFKPPEGLSTPSVFKALDLNALSPRSTESLLESYKTFGAIEAALQGSMVNDLEPPAFACLPSLKLLRDEIQSHRGTTDVAGVMMSGSGTSVYSIRSTAGQFETIKYPVDEILSKFPNTKYFECSFISRTNDIYSWY